MQKEADIGLIGLAVMGQNLVLNMSDHGYTVTVYNRTVEKVDAFTEGPAKHANVIGTKSLEEFFATLKKPKKVMLMVQAGPAVDALIEQCLPFLSKGDIIIDGGNSNYSDSNRRYKHLKEKGIRFIGAGISGGEEGARHGPSIMPGGDPDAWPDIKAIFTMIAAKTSDGSPCCDWVGEAGSGHYVKMVHNGIEYGDMQLICEAYDLMHRGLSLDNDKLQKVFTEWNNGVLKSYLIEITSQILKVKESSGEFLLDKILDVAGQKGTGSWTVIGALDMGMPVTLIGEAVFMRSLSALHATRQKAGDILGNALDTTIPPVEVGSIEKALYAAKILSYVQGFMLMRQASLHYNWNLQLANIASMWRGGCIIKSVFLDKIKEAYTKDKDLEVLLFAPFFKEAIHNTIPALREVVAYGARVGIPLPCLSSALSFYDGIRSKRLPANLLQAQRDFFGSHTYERIDTPRGKFFHTDWLNQ